MKTIIMQAICSCGKTKYHANADGKIPIIICDKCKKPMTLTQVK